MFYIKIKADKILSLYGKIIGGKIKPKASAFYPFLLTTNQIHPRMEKYYINHELIHFAQQKETLLIGNWVWRVIEFLYLKYKRKTGMKLYLSRATEKEAYENMFDLDYLNKREKFAHLKKYLNFDKSVNYENYLKRKTEIENS